MLHKNLNRHPVIEVLFFSLVCMVGALLLAKTPFFNRLESITTDWRFQWRTHDPSKVASDLVLIGIGDKALDEIGRWPWPRAVHGDFLDLISPYQPHTLAFDILFIEPDILNAKSDQRLIESALRQDRLIFAAALEQNSLITPFAPLSDTGLWGMVSLPRDADGVIRRVPLVLRYQGTNYPSLALQMACHHFGMTFEDIQIVDGKEIIMRPPGGATVRIPVDDQYQMLINYRGDMTKFQGSGYQQIMRFMRQAGSALDSDVSDLVRAKTVLIGFTGTGMDIVPTPLDPNSPGVIVHANAYSNIVGRDFLRPLSTGWGILLQFLLFSLIYASAQYASTRWAAPVSGGLIVVYLGLCLLFFFWANILLPMAAPLVISILIILVVISIRLILEAKEKGKIKATFNHFLSGNIMEAILQDPGLLKMGGVRQELSVLFADVKGFTSLCESQPPEVIVPVLNELLDTVTPIIFKHDGTLDKYIGDAVMAFWGAPKKQSDHALRAVRAALEIQKAVSLLEEKWVKKGLPGLGMGIGINSGSMLVGNMGSSEVVAYTVIGDAVNLAARIEALTRKYDSEIIIGEETYLQVSPEVHAESLGEVIVKGKTQPIHIFKVLGLK